MLADLSMSDKGDLRSPRSNPIIPNDHWKVLQTSSPHRRVRNSANEPVQVLPPVGPLRKIDETRGESDCPFPLNLRQPAKPEDAES